MAGRKSPDRDEAAAAPWPARSDALNSVRKDTQCPLANISFGELLLIVAEIFLFVIWIWILVYILTDLFRDHELSGWWKAVWVLFLVFIPFLTALIYLIARGHGMRDRTIKAQAEAKQQFDDYVRTQAQAASPADELHKLQELREKGALSDAEFEQAKAKLLARTQPHEKDLRERESWRWGRSTTSWSSGRAASRTARRCPT